jgi:hypothetical protein
VSAAQARCQGDLANLVLEVQCHGTLGAGLYEGCYLASEEVLIYWQTSFLFAIGGGLAGQFVFVPEGHSNMRESSCDTPAESRSENDLHVFGK